MYCTSQVFVVTWDLQGAKCRWNTAHLESGWVSEAFIWSPRYIVLKVLKQRYSIQYTVAGWRFDFLQILAKYVSKYRMQYIGLYRSRWLLCEQLTFCSRVQYCMLLLLLRDVTNSRIGWLLDFDCSMVPSCCSPWRQMRQNSGCLNANTVRWHRVERTWPSTSIVQRWWMLQCCAY